MKRDIGLMAADSEREPFDLLVIGGGITGACVAWEAALRGLRVALVEANDFSHGTSSASSKLVHGGLRYLANGEFALIRESLKERRIWEMIAPHMVTPLANVFPVYGGRLQRWIMSIALTVYDWIAFDRNRLDDPDKKLPGNVSYSRDEALALEPLIEKDRLSGALVYYDCQMFAPERIGFELVKGAVDRGGHAANHAAVTRFLREGDRITGVQVHDRLSDEFHEVRAKVTVNAAGPWALDLLDLVDGRKQMQRLIKSKGIHLIVRQLSYPHAIAAKSPVGGHFFVLPWRGYSIIGTTDTVFKGEIDDVGVTEQDIESFLEVINEGLPHVGLTREDVLHAYAGIRPLVDSSPEDGSSESYNVSRASEVMNHAEVDGISGLLSAMGGKWTTSRHVGAQIVDLAIETAGLTAQASRSEDTPIPGGDIYRNGISRFSQHMDKVVRDYPQLDEPVARYLSRQYGSQVDVLMARCGNRPDMAERLSDGAARDIAAQVELAAEQEMAMTLEDAVFRRTGLGTLGHPGKAALQRAADIMKDVLRWDEDETLRQIALCEQKFELKPQDSQ